MSASPSRRSRLVVIAVIAAMVVAGVILRMSAPGPGGEGDSPAAVGAPVDRVSLLVDVTRARMLPSRHEIEISSTLKARREVVVGAEVSGRVIELAVEENQQVADGDVLVRLDPALAEAAVERARATLGSARAIAELGRALHARQNELAGQGVGSRNEFDQTLSEATRSAAAVAEARAALLEAETLLDKTIIRAPFAGVVSQFELEPGAYVRTGDAVAEMADLGEIEIDVGVDDRQIITLEASSEVRVAADAYPGEWFEGRIASLGRVPDQASRKYRVPVRVANADMRLLPGMVGRVRFTLGDQTPAIRIPRRAVSQEFELDFVWTLETGAVVEGRETVATVRRTRVRATPVPFRPDLVEVASGLEEGDLVVTSNLRELSDGTRVRVSQREESEVALP